MRDISYQSLRIIGQSSILVAAIIDTRRIVNWSVAPGPIGPGKTLIGAADRAGSMPDTDNTDGGEGTDQEMTELKQSSGGGMDSEYGPSGARDALHDGGVDHGYGEESEDDDE